MLTSFTSVCKVHSVHITDEDPQEARHGRRHHRSPDRHRRRRSRRLSHRHALQPAAPGALVAAGLPRDAADAPRAREPIRRSGCSASTPSGPDGRSSPCSTGARSRTSSGSRARRTTSTCPPGRSSTGSSATTATSGSSTRRTASGREPPSRSTATCRGSGWAPRSARSRSRFGPVGRPPDGHDDDGRTRGRAVLRTVTERCHSGCEAPAKVFLALSGKARISCRSRPCSCSRSAGLRTDEIIASRRACVETLLSQAA